MKKKIKEYLDVQYEACLVIKRKKKKGKKKRPRQGGEKRKRKEEEQRGVMNKPMYTGIFV